jgi:hypothetical protein
MNLRVKSIEIEGKIYYFFNYRYFDRKRFFYNLNKYSNVQFFGHSLNRGDQKREHQSTKISGANLHFKQIK